MIDFTTLQTFPVPSNIVQLQNANNTLRGENNFYHDIILGALVGSVLILSYNYYIKNIYKNEKYIRR